MEPGTGLRGFRYIVWAVTRFAVWWILVTVVLLSQGGAQVVLIIEGDCSETETLEPGDTAGPVCSSSGFCAAGNPFEGITAVIESAFTCPDTPVDNTAITSISIGGGAVGTANAINTFFGRIVGTGLGTASCITGVSAPQFINHPEGCSPPPPPPPPPDCPPDDGTGPICFVDCGNCPSPIIIDLNGKGFSLTDAAHGVLFDIKGTGLPMQIGWTEAQADNGFLALPGPDGLVHSGKELFGNFTPQPPSTRPNGFLALAVYDAPENGGNGDGVIDSNDRIFPALRVWVDANHDGVCQAEELHTLPEIGIFAIRLDFRLDHRTDQYGNVFRYRSKIDAANAANVPGIDKTVYDVFFVHQ